MLPDPSTLAALAAALLCAGVFAGILAGLLGVGGGIVTVPVLFQLLTIIGVSEDVAMHVAVGTSLCCIIPTSISSIRSHLKRGAVDIDLLKSWAPAVAGGVVIGTTLAAVAKGAVLSGVFGTVAMLAVLHMIFGRDHWRLSDHPPTGVIKYLVAGSIGAFSSMMGIGGGTLTVPTLVLCDFPIRRAVATSAAVGLIIAVPGAIGFVVSGWGVPDRPALSLGYVSLLGFALVAPTSVMAAPLGAKLAHSIPPRFLKWAFAVFLGLTASRMLYGALT